MTPCKPIIFSGPMVRAILAGTKTQTRRVLKRPTHHFHASYTHAKEFNGTVMWWDGIDPRNSRMARNTYAPGDLLWVRETWQTGSTADGPQISFRSTPDFFKIDAWDGPDEGIGPSFNYARCPGADFHHWLGDVLDNDGPWRSPIHMPRWASRITLDVTAVKVERLQDITEADAEREGCEDGYCTVDGIAEGWSAKTEFQNLWNSIHGPDAWAANPWVAAYSFRRVE